MKKLEILFWILFAMANIGLGFLVYKNWAEWGWGSIVAFWIIWLMGFGTYINFRKK